MGNSRDSAFNFGWETNLHFTCDIGFITGLQSAIDILGISTVTVPSAMLSLILPNKKPMAKW
jgi:hypothetical protein